MSKYLDATFASAPWDPLRNNPRFQKLLAEPAPKAFRIGNKCALQARANTPWPRNFSSIRRVAKKWCGLARALYRRPSINPKISVFEHRESR